MFCAGLTVYLGLTVAFGPAFCCCSAHDILAFVGVTGSCCDKSYVKQNSELLGEDAHHCGCQGHCQVPLTAEQVSHSPNVPCEHDHKDCPCGKHQQPPCALHSSGTVAIKSIDLGNSGQFLCAVDGLSSSLVGLVLNSLPSVGHFRFGELSGREILRAHSRLQC